MGTHADQTWCYALAVAGCCVAVFAAVAPTLPWLEFSNGAEALNIATAQEILRSGNWLIPTLQGETRLAKPPLTAWITAAAIFSRTMQDISSIDPSMRNQGFSKLAWEVRWPALVAACLTLVATAELGRLVGGPQCGIISLIVAASSFLFLRFCRYSTADVLLTLWVAAANILLLHAALKKRRWAGCIGCGLAVGLAMMSKGPVAWVQSIFPLAIWLWWFGTDRPRLGAGPVLAGLAGFAAIGLPWFVLVMIHQPDAAAVWFREVTRLGARQASADKWYTYLAIIPYLAPWCVFFIAGLTRAMSHSRIRLLPVVLLIVPLAIMSLAPDRNVRYMLPLLPAAAVITAIGIIDLLSSTTLRWLHWGILGLLGVLPVVSLLIQPSMYSPGHAIAASLAAGMLIACGAAVQSRQSSSLVLTSFILMLLLQAVFIAGYRNTRQGRAELKPLAEEILSRYPDAEVFNAHPRGKRPPPELGVYLNRVLRWTADPSAIQPGSRPKVLLMLQDHGQPPPLPPPGWTVLASHKRDKDWWWAFVLLPET